MLDAHPGSGHAVRHARVRVCVRVRGGFGAHRVPFAPAVAPARSVAVRSPPPARAAASHTGGVKSRYRRW